MKSKDFALLPTIEKWSYIKSEMDNITSMSFISDMRQRLNQHHPEEYREQEDRTVKVQQYVKWSAVKDLYAEFRDELTNTLDNAQFSDCKSILERILMQDFDKELKKVLNK